MSERLDVRSADGTSLAVWVVGAGPPLVLVHGSLNDHRTLDPLLDVLRADMTTFSMDRRGFGASGDAEAYAIEREFEDVAAVVDAVAERTGGPVGLFGHSYGASCAMGAAADTSNVGRLVLYEPSLGLGYPPGSIDVIERAVSAGDAETALITVYVEMLNVTDEEIDAMRSSPLWPARLATAPTIAREARVEDSWIYRPGQFDGITASTLLLAGSESGASLREATERAVAAIPNAQVHTLDGHGHMAHKTEPALVAGLIREFVSG